MGAISVNGAGLLNDVRVLIAVDDVQDHPVVVLREPDEALDVRTRPDPEVGRL